MTEKRINIKLNLGGRIFASQVPVGQYIGAAIIFASSSPIQSLEQIGKIYYDDQPSRTVNPRYQLREQDDSKLFIVEANSLPLQCVAEGFGLLNGEVGIPQDFVIRTNKGQGGGWPVQVSIEQPNGSSIAASLSEQESDLYKISFTPESHGEHTVLVTFTVTSKLTIPVGQMIADAINCIAYGPGLEGGEQYKPCEFTIEARNKLGERIPIGGHDFKATLKDPLGNEIPIVIDDLGDGTYKATYTPVFPGNHVVDVRLGDLPVKDNPFNVPIDYSSETAFAGNSYAEGPGLENNVNSNRMKTPAVFTIFAVDKDGNPKKTGGDDFDVVVEDPLFDLLPVKITDNNDGTYTCEYDPKEPGNHHIDIVLRNKMIPMNYEHIKNSPVDVNVKSGTSPENCIAEGPGLKDGIKDTFPADFKIYAKDRDGNPIKEGGDPFLVKITDPDGNDVPCDIIDNNDGTYDCKYQPERDGPHVVAITLDDVPIKDCPKVVNIKPGASAATSFIEGFSFIIHTRDKQGNSLKEGGQNVKTAIKSPTGHVIDTLKQTDCRNGKYLVEYSLNHHESHGLFEITVTVDDENIKGSPFVQGTK